MSGNIKHELLKLFTEPIAYYKGIPVNIVGLPIFRNKKPRSVKNIFYLLKKEGYLNVEDQNLLITKKGRLFLKEQFLIKKSFSSNFPDNAPKDLLVMYDIPEDKKVERDWFRRHLRQFGYLMVQRSVWVGPSPLPKEFLEYVKKIGLKDNLKTFKLAKGYKK